MSERDMSVTCDTINSLTISSAPEVAGLTSFISEACEKVDVLGAHFHKSTVMEPQENIQDLTEYFRRPVLFKSGTLPLGSRTNIFAEVINGTSTLSTYFPNATSRLTGVFGVRFTAVFTLQVATTPFHQGVLALGFQYGIYDYSNNESSGHYFDRAKQPAAVTNLPHARLDLSETTMVTFKVPYIHPLDYIPIPTYADSTYPIGVLGMNVILPVADVTGQSAPSYKVYMHLEDLELLGAVPHATSAIVLQSGAVLANEQRHQGKPFSSGLSHISGGLRMLAKGVPALSSLAGFPAWAVDRAAGLARAFGYSKPTIQDPIMRVANIATVGEHNVDVASGALVAGPCASNTLAIDGVFGATDVDEMALSYVTNQWSQICVGDMRTTDATSATLYATQVSPSHFWFRAPSTRPAANVPPPYVAEAAQNAMLPSNVMFWSSMFKQWKGDLEFRITFSKTKMHGGRVLLTYTPSFEQQFKNNLDNSARIPTNGTVFTPTGYSALFDLRDGNSFSFTVPYIAPSPYMTWWSNTGTLSLLVVDPLQASSVIATTVHFLVEVRGKPNFELAIPTGPLYGITAKSGIRLESGALVSRTKDSVAQYTVGEQLTSAKQLISIPCVKIIDFDTTSDTSLEYDAPPWWIQTPVNSVTQYDSPESLYYGGVISSAYAFVRGSTDYHLYSAMSSTKPGVLHFAYDSAQAGWRVESNSVSDPPAVCMPRIYSTENHIHARLPAYQRLMRLYPSADIGTAGSNPPGSLYGAPMLGKFGIIGTPDGLKGTIAMNRCAGDDAMLASYLGPPPFILPSEMTGGIWYDRTTFQYLV